MVREEGCGITGGACPVKNDLKLLFDFLTTI